MRNDVKKSGSDFHWKYLPGGARLAGKEPTSTWNAEKDAGRLGEEGPMPTRSNEQSTIVGDVHSQTQFETNAFSNAGYTGLTNLGNTCFMNCVLQALANIRELRDYFLSMTFIDDVNEKNPLGTQGRLAKLFYTTLKQLWSGQAKPHAPVKLRNIVASRAPQFLGIMQQDAQEFMAFFLDTLHEDLNRIREKPVFEIGKHDKIPDHILAEKFWRLHKSRNDSFVVDNFHGLYKSKLTCPMCEKESVTFDPFLFLSVPLPKAMQLVSVVFLSEKYDYEIMHCDVKVSEEGGTTAELLSRIAQKYGVRIENLRLFEIESGLVKKEYFKNSPIPMTKLSSLVIYDVGDIIDSNEMRSVFLLQSTEVPETIDICAKCGKCPKDTEIKVRRCTKCKRAGYCNQDCQKSDWPLHKTHCTPRPFISCPLLIGNLQTKTSYEALSMMLLKHAKYTTSIYGKNHEVPNARSSYLADSTMTKSEAQNSFNILLVCNDSMDNLTQIQETGSEVNLNETTHIIIEWKLNVNAVGKSIKCGTRSKKHCDPTLDDCIELFTQPEILAAEEAWYCPNCKKHREATKELSLWHLPDILVIQFKRFSFRNRLWRDKIDKLVSFPVKGLDMSPFCIGDDAGHPIYDLFAVVNHHGGLFGGHYTSYVKLTDESGTNPDLGWRLCDDSHVTSVRSEEDVVTSSAYVVFYHRRKQASFDSSTENEIWHSAEDISFENVEKCDFEKPHFSREDDASAISNPQLHEEIKKNVTIESKFSLDVTSRDKNALVDKITTRQSKSDSVEVGSGESTNNKDIFELTSNVGLLYTDMDAVD